MNKKLIIVLIVSTLILSTTIANLGASDETIKASNNNTSEIKECKLTLSNPVFEDDGEYITVKIDEQTSFLIEENKPILPMITKVFKFPLGTKINNVDVQLDQKVYTLDKKIKLSPEPTPLMPLINNNKENEVSKNQKDSVDITIEDIYANLELYPSEPYKIKMGAGLDGEEHVLYLNVRCYTQYKASENKIYIPREIKIDIDYNPQTEPLFNDDVYDLLIITHEKFEEDLQPLVTHKNNIGIKTKMTTVDEIYPAYEGVNDYEDIKLYIADAIKNWGITYVLLAGGHVGQTHEWYVPDFRSHNYDNNGMGDMDKTYSCDLYYSDVFYIDKYGKPIFDDWDNNKNGIPGEGPYYDSFDLPDFYPDVYVGRIPLRYSWETPIVVDKIIDYELNANPSWFKKAVVAGGDTSPKERYPENAIIGIYEGELTCDNTANYLEDIGFEVTKCYTSDNGDVKVDDDNVVASVISNGCGWVNMQMHANPAVGGNHVMDTNAFIYFYTILNIKDFNNANKLPFMVNDGCHNAQYDVTMQDIIDNGGMNYPAFGWLEWVPEDGSSWLIHEQGGGAIGVIGNTALGYGYLNEHYDHGLGGWIMPRFAHAYAVQGREYTGSIWGQGITDYIDNFNVMTDDVERKTIEERTLLGDPSIKLGGVGMAALDKDIDEEDDYETTSSLYVDVPVWEKGMSWTYEIDNIDIRFSEIEGRSIDFKLNTEDLKLKVVDVQSNYYITEFSTNNANIEIDLDFDYYMEDKEPVSTYIKLNNVDIAGEIVFDKTNLAIKNVDANLKLDLVENLDGLPIDLDLGPLITKLLSFIKLPVDIDIQAEFNPAYKIFDFPFETGKTWGLPASNLTLDIGGKVSSIWLRLINLFNNIFHFIPPELAKYLPEIDIAEILEDFGMPSQMQTDIPELKEMLRKPIFELNNEKTISVPAGSYNTYQLMFIQGFGELYYSADVGNFVKISMPINEFLPLFQNIDMVLKSTNQ